MSLGVALQAIVTGLAQGAVYGLVGLGFALCYRLVRVLDFAHGDLVVGSLFAGVLVTVGTTPVVTTPSLARAAAQVAVSVLGGAGLGLLLYVAAVRPFTAGRGAAALPGGGAGWVATTLAAGLLVREALGVVFTREAYSIADPLRFPTSVLRLPGDGRLPVRFLGVLAVALAVGLLADAYVVRSRTGRAMRAVADDREAAGLVGVPADRVVAVAFALAGALAGLAGVLAMPGTSATVAGGVVLGLKGVAAALLGRLGSLRGALAGGLALGVVESLAVSSDLLGAAYGDVLVLGVLVAVLAWHPEGLGVRRHEAVE